MISDKEHNEFPESPCAPSDIFSVNRWRSSIYHRGSCWLTEEDLRAIRSEFRYSSADVVQVNINTYNDQSDRILLELK